jgi:hypothetical protein
MDLGVSFFTSFSKPVMTFPKKVIRADSVTVNRTDQSGEFRESVPQAAIT